MKMMGRARDDDEDMTEEEESKSCESRSVGSLLETNETKKIFFIKENISVECGVWLLKYTLC